MANNVNYLQVLDLAGVQQLWNTAKQTFVQTVNGQGIDANGNVNVDTDYKSLYKIGKYDNFVDNGDGTITIARKTGYIVLESLSWTWTNSRYWLANYIANIGGASNDAVVAEMVCNNYTPNTIDNVLGGANGIAFKKPTGEILCVNGSSYSSPEGIIEFELETSYTEKVIANVPNNVYDNFLIREYGEKSNVYIGSPNFSNAITDSMSYFNAYVSVNGVYMGGLVVNSTGRKSITFTTPANTSNFIFRHSGASRDFDILNTAIPFLKPTTLYTISFNVNSYNASAIGGLSLSNIMINEGSQVLPYYPTNQPVLLWENGSPTSDFYTNIQIPTINDYKYIVIAYKDYVSAYWGINYHKCGNKNQLIITGADGFYRKFNFSGTTMSIDHATNGSTTNDSYVIPVAVYGTNTL